MEWLHSWDIIGKDGKSRLSVERMKDGRYKVYDTEPNSKTVIFDDALKAIEEFHERNKAYRAKV